MPIFTTHDGTSLFYREWGTGQPILFLSGLGMVNAMWDYQFQDFATAGYRCVGFDRRGHGRSDQSSTGYDFDSLADDVDALIRKLDLKQITLVGHSMAAGEIVRYLTRHGSSRVARAVFVGPTTPKLMRDDDNPTGIPRAEVEALWQQWARDYPRWIDENSAPYVIPETSRPLMRWAASLIQLPIPVAVACGRIAGEADFRAEMRAIDIPALVIQGDRDRSAPLELTGQPSAKLLRKGRLVVYEGAPHGLMYTHRERLQADITSFIAA